MMNEENSKKITKFLTITLGMLSVFLLVLVIGQLKKIPNIGREIYPQSSISASGEGEAVAIPDIATLSFTVDESGESVEAAQGLLDEKVSKAINTVKTSGVDEKDIKTTSYNVFPKYEWKQKPCVYSPLPNVIYPPCPGGTNELIGYEVSQTVSIKIRDVKKAGEIVSKIGAVNISNISGVEFTVDDRDKYVAEARNEAIAKAKAQAQEIAKGLGVRLGKVMYFNESGNYPGPYYYGEGAGMGADVRSAAALQAKADLPVGETKITSNVTITYEIK